MFKLISKSLFNFYIKINEVCGIKDKLPTLKVRHSLWRCNLEAPLLGAAIKGDR